MPVTKVKSNWKHSGKIADLVFENVASGTEILGIYNSGAVNVAALYISGTSISTTAAEMNQIAVTAYIASAETAEKTVHIVAPHAGTVAKVYSVNHMAQSANGTGTLVILVSASTAGTISLGSGAASGTVGSLTPSSKTVAAGGVIKARVSASSQTKTCPVTVTAIITR